MSRGGDDLAADRGSARGPPHRTLGSEDRQDLIFPEDHIFLAVEFHLGAGVLAEKDAIAGFYIDFGALPGVEQTAAADLDHFGLLWFLFCAVGHDYPAAHGFSLFDAVHEHTGVQWTEFD